LQKEGIFISFQQSLAPIYYRNLDKANTHSFSNLQQGSREGAQQGRNSGATGAQQWRTCCATQSYSRWLEAPLILASCKAWMCALMMARYSSSCSLTIWTCTDETVCESDGCIIPTAHACTLTFSVIECYRFCVMEERWKRMCVRVNRQPQRRRLHTTSSIHRRINRTATPVSHVHQYAYDMIMWPVRMYSSMWECSVKIWHIRACYRSDHHMTRSNYYRIQSIDIFSFWPALGQTQTQSRLV
jgi:hypothetical protein